MLRAIRNKSEHEAYLERAYELMQMDFEVESDEYNELEVLSILIETFEKDQYPADPPHPIEAIKFRMEQMGLKRSELQRILGSRSRASEILSGKRKLSLNMIRRLNEKLGISAETLIRDYELTALG